MREAGLRILPAESLIQQIVQGQGREPFLAADDLRDLHQMVVHDVGQVVGRQFVGAFPEHLVVERIAVDFDVAADQVVHRHDPVFRNSQGLTVFSKERCISVSTAAMAQARLASDESSAQAFSSSLSAS